MKNYLIKKAKKSVSLMMALLMVLSCWVWVAPMEAEAANAENGEYAVRLVARSSDDGEVTAVSCKVYYDGGSKSLTGYPANLKNGGTPSDYTLVAADGDLPKFPTKFEMSITIDGCNGHKNGTYFFRLEVYNNRNKSWDVVNNDDGQTLGWSDFKDTKSIDNAGSQTQIKTDVMPKVAEIKAPAAVSLKVPKLGSGSTVSTNAATFTAYDQYGVKLLSGVNLAYHAATAGGEKLTQEQGAWAPDGSNKVTINENLQKTVSASSNGTGSIALVATAGEASASQTINLTYEGYTIKFDGNGRTGNDPNAVIKLNNGTASGSTSATGYYGTDLTAYPTGEAEKTGYTFKGFWTNQQPASGDASVNAYEASFATPVTKEEYDKYAAMEGSTTANNIVTLADGTKYANGGSQWNTENLTVAGDAQYYGWWISTDINVKFYDINGAYLETITYKYGQKGNEVDWAVPTNEYKAGAYEYSTFKHVWMDIRGFEVDESSYVFGQDGDLVLNPLYTNKVYKSKYQISFINPLNGSNLSGSGEYEYRAEVPSTPSVTLPAALSNASDYSYVFAGWSSETPAGGKYYHIIANDNDTFVLNNDWIVREDTKYYPVFRSTVRQYVVQFNYTDSTGTPVSKIETIAYGDTISTPEYVNNTYATEGMGFVLQGWKYQNNENNQSTFDNGTSLLFTNENVAIAVDNRADGVDEVAIIFTAAYDNGTPVPYNVTFKYKAADGTDVVKPFEVEKDEKTNPDGVIGSDVVSKVVVPGEYDDGEAVYTFSGTWKVTEGATDKEFYTTDEFAAFAPKSHVTFEAVYGEGTPYRTVKYVDGSLSKEYKVLDGYNLPAWTITTIDDNGTPDNTEDDITKEVPYAPAEYKTDKGTYEFVGWFDAKQTDADYKVTNGNEYVAGETVINSDVTLYSQFVYEPFKFRIEFYNYDRSVQLAAGDYEYGQDFSDAFYRAQKAAIGRAADETYEYEFIGWDQPYNEDNLVCEGKAVTYIALYKASHKYYKANWYNDENAPTPLVTTKHVYKGKVYSPSVKTTAPAASQEGYTCVFDYWYYLVDGKEVKYVRGMEITSDMNFYAEYKEVANAHTITTVVGTTETAYPIEHGTKANEKISDPASGYVDADKHNKFAGWYKDASYATEFDIENENITSSFKIYAKFVESAHDVAYRELVAAPDYYNTGSEKTFCSCGMETASTIPVLTDTVAPTGTIYLGGTGWSSTGTNAALDTNTYYANADTDVIITANDTGDVNTAYNPSGLGKGIKLVRAFVYPAGVTITAGNFGAAQQAAITVYSDDSEELTNKANYSIKLGEAKVVDLAKYNADGTIEFIDLVDGEEYIVYYYVIDKAGRELNTNVRTAKFTYDTTPPVFTVEGKSNAANNVIVPTYCETATITGVEEGAVVKVNGKTPDTLVISTAGNYTITVTDKAGNSTTKKIIVADHNTVTYETSATCGNAGSKTVVCLVCAETISSETYEALAHNYTTTTIPASCDANEKVVKECLNCGEKTVTEVANTKLSHQYGEFKVTTKATCTTDGKKVATCTLCKKATITETIPHSDDAHVYGGLKVSKPTCTEDGYYYQICKYCQNKKDGDPIEATGHEETEKKVTTKATCSEAGVESEICKKCGETISTSTIPATGKHVVYVVSTVEPTATTKGLITYGCENCDWTETEEIDTLELYTVVFVDDNGTELAEFADVVVKTAIEAEDITAPSKVDESGKYEYKFAGWKDADGKTVSFPYYVEGDATLTASYTRTTKIYTHKFMVPTSWNSTYTATATGNIEFATIMGAMGDTNKKPVAEPVFKDANNDAELKKLYTFKFLGWSTTGAEADIVTDFTIAGDATFYAIFDAVSLEYEVIFYNYNTTDFIWKTTVSAGDTVTFAGDLPSKAYDDDYHYEFAGWCTDKALNNVVNLEDTVITADTRLYAKFNAIEHEHDKANGEVTQEQTCTLPELTTYKCACGDDITEQTKKAAGHVPGEAVTETVEGIDYSVVYCTVCGEEINRQKTTSTVIFENHNGVRLATYNLSLNASVVYEGKIPEKASDDEASYTFAGWYVKGDINETAVNFDEYKVTGDVTFVAKFESTTRTYRVTYVGKDGTTTLYTVSGIAYGSAVPAYVGEIPVYKDYFDTYSHNVFDKWNVAADATVTGDLVITPSFKKVAHTLEEADYVEPTCTEVGGVTQKCKYCDYKSPAEDEIPALGHKWDSGVVTKEPNHNTATNGEKLFTCTVCGDTKTEEIKAESLVITIKVADTNGTPIQGAIVKLYDSNKIDIMKAETNADGKVTFTVPKGTYTYSVEYNGEVVVKDQSASDGDNTAPSIKTEPECSCSCHRTGFWGIIFRLFQKLIKLFTGKINCCACPDAAYN